MAWKHARQSRQARGYGRQWEIARDAAMKRDKGLCQTCLAKDRVTVATEVDHITSKAKGGTDHPDNLSAICTPCHRDKTAREAAEAQGRPYRRKVTIGLDGWPEDG